MNPPNGRDFEHNVLRRPMLPSGDPKTLIFPSFAGTVSCESVIGCKLNSCHEGLGRGEQREKRPALPAFCAGVWPVTYGYE